MSITRQKELQKDLAIYTYTPEWTGNSSNPSIGNGTIVGKYKIIGKTCFFEIKIVMGSTTSFGSGIYYVTLPVQKSTDYANNVEIVGTASLDNIGVATYMGIVTINNSVSTNRIEIRSYAGGAGGALSSVTPTVPFTFADGDGIYISGMYIIN